MFKRLLFQLHWLSGISAGLVLAIMGLTGGVYAFEEDLLRLLNPAITQVTPGQMALEPAALLASIAVNRQYVSSLTLSGAAQDAARVGFMLPVDGSSKKKFDLQYVNPYTGQLLGKPRGEEFFRLMLNLHRSLALGDAGQAITGASALALVFMCVSGIYLRWPRSGAGNWRFWLLIGARRKGRAFLADLHAVSATWLMALYLLAALTGLYWSYDWFHDLVTSIATPAQQTVPAIKKDKVPVAADEENVGKQINLQAVWQGLRAEVPSYDKLIMLLPAKPGQPVRVLFLDGSSPHRYANSSLLINAQTGSIIKREPYAAKPAGGKFIASIYALHSGSYWGNAGMLVMMLAALLLPLFAVTGWMMYVARRKTK